jgi:hypothetical protein
MGGKLSKDTADQTIKWDQKIDVINFDEEKQYFELL